MHYLIVVNQIFEFVSMDDNMQAAHLSQSEFFAVNAGETNFFPRASATDKISLDSSTKQSDETEDLNNKYDTCWLYEHCRRRLDTLSDVLK